MLCSMCQNGVDVKQLHRCAQCAETLCRHFGKHCPKCRPTPPMEYNTNSQTWQPKRTPDALPVLRAAIAKAKGE